MRHSERLKLEGVKMTVEEIKTVILIVIELFGFFAICAYILYFLIALMLLLMANFIDLISPFWNKFWVWLKGKRK